jgi:PAS domain S-box-containing protein
MQQNPNIASQFKADKPAPAWGRRHSTGTAAGIGSFFQTLDSDDSHSLKLMLQYLLDLVGGGLAVYHQFRKKNQQVYVQQAVGCPAKFRQYGRSSGRVCFEAFDPHRPSAIAIDDLRSTPYWQSDPDLRRYGLKAFLGCSVCLDGEIIGSLALYDYRSRQFSVDNLTAVEMIAAMAAYLDKHRRAESRLSSKVKHEQMLAEITSNAISILGIDRSLSRCLEILGNTMDADSVHLFHKGPDGQELSGRANWWQESETGAALPHDLSELISLPMVSRVLSTGEAYPCSDVQTLSDAGVGKILRRCNIRSFIVVPLNRRKFVSGVCFVCRADSPYTWLSTEMNVLRSAARILAKRLSSRSISFMPDESEALVYQRFQQSPVMLFRIDLAGQRFIAVNDHTCRVTGYSKEEFLAIKPMSFLTSESQKLCRQRLKAMAEGRSVSNIVDYEVVMKSGGTEWTRLHMRYQFRRGRIVGAMAVAHFVTEQKKVREELALYRQELESQVQARTAELAEINRQLRDEIEQRKQTALELQASSDRLQEMNTAMSVLLDKRSEDHQRAEELIRLNLKELIEPFLNRLENSGLRGAQKQLLEIIRMNLEEVVGSPTPEFSSKYYIFSPNELQVANLIRQGRTSKEVARLLNLSVRTVDSYRDSIRKKLGLKNKKVNLRIYLASL